MKRLFISLFVIFYSMSCLATSRNEIVVFSIFHGTYKKVTVEEAEKLGQWIATHHLRLVTTASDDGYFGSLIHGALSNGGDLTVGVFEDKTVGQISADIQRNIKKHNFSVENSDLKNRVTYRVYRPLEMFHVTPETKAVILFPGGIGATKAFFDVLLNNMFRPKEAVPVVIYNVDHYWDNLEKLVNQVVNTSGKKPADVSLYFAKNTKDLEKYLLSPR